MPSATHWPWERLTDASRRLFTPGAAEADDGHRATQHDVAGARDGNSAPLTLAASLESLARTKYAQLDLAGAEALFRSALVLRDDTAGPDDAATIPTLDTLASICVERGEHDEAEALLERALVAASRAAADPGELAVRLDALAELHVVRGHHAAAEPLLVRLLDVTQRMGGSSHEIAAVLTRLASVQAALGHHDHAEQLLRRALAATGVDALLQRLADEVAAQGRAEEAVGIRGGVRAAPAPELAPRVQAPPQPREAPPAARPAVETPSIDEPTIGEPAIGEPTIDDPLGVAPPSAAPDDAPAPLPPPLASPHDDGARLPNADASADGAALIAAALALDAFERQHAPHAHDAAGAPTAARPTAPDEPAAAPAVQGGGAPAAWRWESVQLSPPSDREVLAPLIPVFASQTPATARPRSGATARRAAAIVLLAVLALLAGRAVARSLGANDGVDAAARTDSVAARVAASAAARTPSTASAYNRSRVGERASAPRERAASGEEGRAAAARARESGAERAAALPETPEVVIRLDTRALDESVRARAESAVRRPPATLPPITRPEGPLPMVDGRRYDRRQPR